MVKVGQVHTDSHGGSFCLVTLDSGEMLLVQHERFGSLGGELTIEVTGLLGARAERVFRCDLAEPAGEAILTWLTLGAEPGSPAATPLGSLVQYVTEARTLTDLRAKCAALMASHHAGA